MSLLCIDTSLNTASVCIAAEGQVVKLVTNNSQQDHAAWIHGAIREILNSSESSLPHLDAIAVTSGPGSYTGLRVGMATAKGLCYALGVPLITENILFLTAMQAARELTDVDGKLLCPMIDARRMEVFTAIYDSDLVAVLEPRAEILNESSFADMLDNGVLIFCGNGSSKWKNLCSHPNAVFADVQHKPENLARIAWEKWQKRSFANLAYTEPDYFKNFYTGNEIF